MYLKTAFLFACVCTITIRAQIQNNVLNASEGLDQFTINLLRQTVVEAGDDLNIALSPFTIWTLLSIISEGAGNNTLRELEQTLGIPSTNKDSFRQGFRTLLNNLKQNDGGVRLDFTNAIFTTNEFPLNETFQRISQNIYNVDVIPVDFQDSRSASAIVNNYIARATSNRIPQFVTKSDLTDAAIFMTSALFFKGQWRYPFNKTATKPGTKFYDDSGRLIGNVEMMYQAGAFPYFMSTKLNAYVAELPYGDADKMSMILVVPRTGERLTRVLDNLSRTTTMAQLLDELAISEQQYPDEDVEIYVPKFKIESELNLNEVLSKMGISDVFNAGNADLLGIFPEYLYLSRVLQKAVIDVDEEGTVAAAVAGASLAYKAMSPKLVANKPFAFFIVDKQMKSIIFAGKISNPSGICQTCTRN